MEGGSFGGMSRWDVRAKAQPLIPAPRPSAQIREQRRAYLPFDEHAFGLAHVAGFELLQPLSFAGDERRHRNSIAIENAIIRERRNFGPGQDAADEIQRIGGAQRDPGRRWRRAAHLAQQAYRLGERKLLSRDSRNEAAAANLAARFQTSQHAQQLAPWGKPRRLALEQAPEHDPVAAQQD